VAISTALDNLLSLNRSTKYVDTIIHVCNMGECVSHHLSAWPMNVSTRICVLPFSPMDFATSSTWVEGECCSLYRKGLLV
jgi:hypothetical protein